MCKLKVKQNWSFDKKAAEKLCFKNNEKAKPPLCLLSLVLIIFMLPSYSSCSPNNTSFRDDVMVEFADTKLETAVREELDIPEDAITELDMLGLTSLEAVSHEIECLDGLEYATNLERLWLSSNDITDISPLAELTDLKVLWLDKNDITDISALKRLHKLSALKLGFNSIKQIKSLTDLTELKTLWLTKNDIADITPLKRLNKLWMLQLGSNNITDISPLANLTNLRALYIYSNDITDISPLENLTNLESLGLHSNDITDISPLEELTDLKRLRLESNTITDISPLVGLDLESILLNSNTITDISPLIENESLTSGDTLRIKGNPLSSTAYSEHIPELENRGLRIRYDKPGEIHGSVFHSSTGEGLEGVTVYLDVDHDGEFDDWEVSTTTSSNGTYSFKPIGAYNYQVRIITKDEKPVESPPEGYYTVDLSETEQVNGKDFELARDF